MDEEIKTGGKMPPIEKVYEAWSAIADGRVCIKPGSTAAEGKAEVESSSHEKTYTVAWRDGGKLFYSDDNSTYWRGYPGYPVIAVMMLEGLLPYDAKTAERYSGINWTEANLRHRHDYAEALREVEADRAISHEEMEGKAREVLDALAGSGIAVTRKRKPFGL